jgi:SAM-dependent methyltransferase
MYRLFGDLAHRYDLHTPPDHYQHDHAFVLEQAAALGSPCRLLDVGCGTGVLVEKALRAGMLARGIDASAAMIRVAEERVGKGAVAVGRMQEIDEVGAYDLVASLSWTLNYCEGRADLLDVLRRLGRAVRPGGGVLVQVAHAPNVQGDVMEDREPGPTGAPDDVVFLYRFARLDGEDLPMSAEYVYACKSQNELVHDRHLLHMADASAVAECMREVGFGGVRVYDSWRRDALTGSASPFVSGNVGPTAP